MRRYVLLLLSPVLALCQNISGSISGGVTDSLGAPFAGVEVSIASAQTGFSRGGVTNASGYFSFPDLAPAVYALSISAPGFKRYSQSGIQISSGEQRALGVIRLQLGEVSDSITVTAEAAPVTLGSGERAGVMTSSDLEHMALRGRDLMDAVGLLPGVVDTSDSREAPSADSIGNIYILGGRSNQKNMTIDGVSNLDTGSNGSVHSMPSMDSVGEVKVLMSNYAAEYGRNSGGSITVITKGGGKQVHGSAGWYHRHENYSANEYFANRNGLARQPYRYNIAGYTLSGPVTIPGRFNRHREKVFFFFSQEFQRQVVDFGSRTVRVPTALERAGDFSQSFDVNSRVIPVYDPLDNQRQFPGNRIPASRHTGIGRRVLNLFPLPNFIDPAPSRRDQWNYLSALSGPYPRRTEIARLDYAPLRNTVLYLRLNHSIEEQHPPFGVWVNGSLNYPLTPIVYRRPGLGATLHGTVTLSPTWFSESIFGVSQNKLYYYPEFPERVSRKATGIEVPQWNPDLNPEGYLPNMSFSSVPNYANPSMSNGIPYYNSNTIFSLVQNLSKVAGRHVYKLGLYFERTRKDQSASVATRGTVSFDRDRNNPLDTNYAYSNALLGVYASYSEATARPQGQFRFSNLEWYAQDAWRVRPRLLVDYGVRFYHDMPQYDARLQLASFVPSLFDPTRAPVLLRPGFDAGGKKVAVDSLSGATYSEGLIGTYVPGVGNPSIGMAVGGRGGLPRGLYSTPAVSLAPRLGLAWDPFGQGRTAIRGGGGVFFDRIQGNPTMGTLANPPTIYTPTVFFGSLDKLADTGGRWILAPSGTVTSLLGRHTLPTVYNYSLGLQQQVKRNMILDVSYVGAVSRHFLWERNINPVPIGATHLDKHPENKDPTANRALPTNFLRPYQGYGNINLFEFASTSSYNSLQVAFDRRLSGGLQAGVAYTWSKTLGSAATDTTTVSSFFAPRERNYGLLNYDRRHVLSLRYYWALPRPGKASGHRGLGRLTDGWELSGISRFMSGAPFTPGYSLVSGVDITGTPSESARVVVVDPRADPVQRFTAPQRGMFGNAGVGVLTGPGVNNWDISLYRQFRLAERRTAQLRFETYNTFNHTQFRTLSTTARFDPQGAQVDPLFLEPTESRGPRRIQLALRVNW
ncbi:MAG: TonB-dependent receptor [Candidatus Solibacter usitatus]|nr:TonB-dependent receptor [Candidatus Solibacter usitatus]